MKKYCFILTCLILLIPFTIYAQTAAELEILMNAPSVTYAKAALFVLGSAGIGGSSLNSEEAFNLAVSNGWLTKAASDDAVRLDKLSYLIMKAFNINGGLMYILFPGPRYAYRTMISRSFIQGASDPSMTVDGRRFLLILGRVLNTAGDR